MYLKESPLSASIDMINFFGIYGKQQKVEEKRAQRLTVQNMAYAQSRNDDTQTFCLLRV